MSEIYKSSKDPKKCSAADSGIKRDCKFDCGKGPNNQETLQKNAVAASAKKRK